MEIKLILFRLLTLVALAACCASLLDHVLPSPAFCGFKAGCDAVTQSSFGSLLGVPLPVWGLLAFGVFYALTLFPNHPLARLVSPAAIVAGLSGLALIVLQVFVIEQLCPLCLITDAAAVLILAVEIGFAPPKNGAVPVAQPRQWLWISGALFAIAGPLVWPIVRPIPPVPEQVQAYWVADRITVVKVTDFECPHCRTTQASLTEFLRRHQERLHFVQLVKPLDPHANAQIAARAYLCADAQGRALELSDALFALDERSADACRHAAASLGLDMEQYDRCVKHPDTDAQIEQLTAWLDHAGVQGLPVIWIHDQRLVGEQTVKSLEAALARAQRRKQ